MSGYAVITKNPRYGTYDVALCLGREVIDVWEVGTIFIDEQSRKELKPVNEIEEENY